jgi:cytochrome c-type biogenesis protein CcmH/NrfG
MPLTPSDEDFPPVERARRLVVKAKSYLMQDRTSEAIRALEQALKLDGDSKGAYETWLLLGRSRLTNPAWSTRAIEALQVASRLNPRAAEPWALMGELYYRKGFQANAQGCFRRALELDPSVAVPAGWSTPDAPTGGPTRDPQSSLMGKLRGMFGREKD